ncbi:MAG: hypothetical protein H7Y06_01355 [Opitutaceae bacterium]|nr:hypothetical protein [Opitutaceae bacterium]
MPRLTRRAAALTTRKLTPPLALLTMLLCGCSTPGVNHTYVAGPAHSTVIDLLPGSPSAAVETFPTSDHELLGIAYDPFTDHLFLRIYPGNFIRVIDRPAGKIKRSFYVPNLLAGPGDLAIRSIDRHLFIAHPSLPAVVEITPLGAIVRTLPLHNLQAPPAGVAYDQKKNRLLILQGGDLAHVGTYDLSGKRLAGVALDRNVRLTSLAYDSDAAEFYVPLLDQPAVGIFNAQGHLIRTLPSPTGRTNEFIDVGPRSLIRMF